MNRQQPSFAAVGFRASKSRSFLLRYAYVFLSSALLLASSKVQAVQNIEVTAPQLRIYTKPDLLSPVLVVLKRGTLIFIADNPTGAFKKVLVKDPKGAKKVGFISLADLRGTRAAGSAVVTRAKKANSGRFKTLHNRWSGGLLLGINYQTEGAKTYTDGQGGSANVGALSGSALMFGGFVDMPFTSTLNFEGFLLYKPTSGTATASPNSSVVGTTSQTIILAENFISLGAVAKFYNSPVGSWWYGGGFEIDHGSSGTLQYGSGTPIVLQSSDLPNLLMVLATTGYDMALGGNFFFVPRINFGVIFNTSPVIIEVDGAANLTYAF